MAATTKSGRRVDLIDRYADLMHTPEFEILIDGLYEMDVCTSLDEAHAAKRANLIPPREGWQWTIDEAETLHCYHIHHGHTHRHMLLKAVRCG